MPCGVATGGPRRFPRFAHHFAILDFFIMATGHGAPTSGAGCPSKRGKMPVIAGRLAPHLRARGNRGRFGGEIIGT